jgi:putative nucleotidyltransferase with HDIG domain
MRKKYSSLFDQSLERSVFVTYFLGGIVPLLGFAFVSERLMPMIVDRNTQWGMAGLVIGTGILSLVSYLALRRIIMTAAASMAEQNGRLESLLEVARELAEAPHAQVVAESASCWAQRLCGADASWVLNREGWDKPFEVMSQRGEAAAKLFERHRDEWTDLVDRAMGESETIRIDGQGSENPSVVITPLAGELEPGGVLVAARSGMAFSPAEVDALSTLSAQARVALMNAERGDTQRNFFSHMTDLVIAALDAHIEHRAGHAGRVAEYANRVGRSMGLDETQLHDLHFAALLHDVGMLKIPAANQKDPAFFRKHSTVGYKILSRIRVWEGAAPIVLQHHERLDGGGYPDGVMGDDICLGARILAVCDAWDAMRTDDSHRPAIPVEQALTQLQTNADTQFDPDVVATFTALVTEGVV